MYIRNKGKNQAENKFQTSSTKHKSSVTLARIISSLVSMETETHRESR